MIMQVVVFWLSTALCTIAAVTFIVPPIFHGVSLSNSTRNSFNIWRYSFSVAIVIIFCSLVYVIYNSIGVGKQLPKFYSQQQISIRDNNKQIRPLYARLQRELLKTELNQAVDLANIDLILHFAKIHAQIGNGVLPSEIVTLLQHVIRTNPTQVTALDLLNTHKSKIC